MRTNGEYPLRTKYGTIKYYKGTQRNNTSIRGLLGFGEGDSCHISISCFLCRNTLNNDLFTWITVSIHSKGVYSHNKYICIIVYVAVKRTFFIAIYIYNYHVNNMSGPLLYCRLLNGVINGAHEHAYLPFVNWTLYCQQCRLPYYGIWS